MRARSVDRVLEALASFQGEPCSWLVGEPGDPPPEVLVDAMKAALASPHHLYSPPAGLSELREVIAGSERAVGRPVTSDRITITNGAKSGLFVLLNALLRPGDEVLTPVPCYPAYPELVRLAGAAPVEVSLGTRSYGVDHAVLDRAAGPRTRAILLSSPSNPTGATLGEAQARALVEWCSERRIVLISDEAYEAFRFTSDSVSSPAAFDPDHDTVVQVRSFSKTFNVCGWRIGYLVANPRLSRVAAQRQSALVNPPNTPAQMALTALPSVPETYLREGRHRVRERLQRVGDVLTTCGFSVSRPEGGFYLWLDIRDALRQGGWDSSAAWCTELAAQRGVVFWPGEDYLAPGWVRCSAVACPEPGLDEALGELERRLLGQSSPSPAPKKFTPS